jgi:hypothetical protein
MNVKTLLIVSTIPFFLSGCFWNDPEPVKVKTECEEKVHLALKTPSIPKLEGVKWVLITEDNYKEIFAVMKKANIDPVLFGLDDDNYINLSNNAVKLRNFTNSQRIIINEYKKYYETPKEK